LEHLKENFAISDQLDVWESAQLYPTASDVQTLVTRDISTSEPELVVITLSPNVRVKLHQSNWPNVY